MSRDSETTNDSRDINILNNMYVTIINTIKMASCQNEEIFPVIDVTNNDFTVQTQFNSML